MKMPFKHGERVLCVKESPDLMLDGSIADNARCIVGNIYPVEMMVWTSKAGWMIGMHFHYGCIEFHSAQDFVSSGYPRYFVGKYWGDADAYVRFDSKYDGVWVRNTGEESPQSGGSEWDADKPNYTWKEVTEAEAKRRLKPPQNTEEAKLQWTENCKPDKEGIWAHRCADGKPSIYNIFAKDLDDRSWSPATRCYLGPIPEIIMPRKKVVERLWIKHITHITGTDAQYRERWIEEGHTCTSDWIKTDRTREAI